MVHRDVRMVDSQLMGHTINSSASFFASTNLLLIAAVGGILFGGEGALRGVAAVGAELVSLPILEGKLALILVCLARGLLDFIWAIRQRTYTLALTGAAPELGDDGDRIALGEAAAGPAQPGPERLQPGGARLLFRAGLGRLAVRAVVAGGRGRLGLRPADLATVRSPAARAVRSARRLLELK